MKYKSMSSAEAERQFYTLKEAHESGRKDISMIRDSWEGGHTVQFTLSGTCVASLIRSGDCISFSGRWM